MALLAGLLLVGCTTANPPLKAAPPATVTAPASPTPKTCQLGARLAPGSVVSVIGDSYSSRGGARGWPAQLARRAHLTVHVDAVDGSGYVAPGLNGQYYNGLRFPDQVPKLRSQRPDLVIIMGSANDIHHTDPPQYPAAVARTLAAIRRTAPTASLLVVGTFWPGPNPPGSVYYIHDVLRDAAADVACASFLDPVKEGWFAHPEGYFGPDGEHPNDVGLDRVTDLYVRDLRRLGYL